MTQRDDFIQGLLDLATWLEQNPDVPVQTQDISYHVLTDNDDTGLARLDEIAAHVGVDITNRDCGQPIVRRNFGPVAYEAVYVMRHRSAYYANYMRGYAPASEAGGGGQL